MSRFAYRGQCDRLRREPGGEARWRDMMRRAAPVELWALVLLVDLRAILDEDEAPHRYLHRIGREDPDAGAYLSWWGDRRCAFLRTAGFEFIFVDGTP